MIPRVTATVDLTALTEPILACPNDPDDVRLLSGLGQEPLDLVPTPLHAHHARPGARLKGSDQGGAFFVQQAGRY